MINIYFLFLIKDKIFNKNIWNNFFKNAYNFNIIIHPKEKNKKVYIHENEIILDPINTKWGDISLADAEIYLLKESLKDKKKNSYYILLSGDTIPLYNYNKLYEYLNKQELSIFNYKDYMIGNKKKNNYYYSSQFFCINYKDANIVVNNYNKYRNRFTNIKMYSPDEIFILSILFYENRFYKFIDSKFTNTTFFYYIKTIDTFTQYIKNSKKLIGSLYELKENGRINELENNILKMFIKFKNYGMLHPYTFDYDSKLNNQFKKKFYNSFFLRKIVDEKNNNVLIFKDFIDFNNNIVKKNLNKINIFLKKFVSSIENNTKFLGAHIDISEGLLNASKELNKYNGNVIQIIKRHASSDIFNKENIYKFNKFNKNNNIKVFIHSNYTINLALDWDKYSWWIKYIINEFELASKIFAEGVVVHCGKKLNMTLQESYNNMFSSILYILNKTEKYKDINFIIETSSGQGSETLTKLEDLAYFINKFKNTKYENRIKLCIDTCHIFAAGYDIRDENKVNKYIKSLDKLIGLEKVVLIHLNDSKEDLSSHKDRHESIGKGKIGLKGLNFIKNFFLDKNISVILETPNKSYKKEINFLKNN